jgi:hypothetical protein
MTFRTINQLIPEERFWLQVNIQRDGCWEWKGHTDPRGYAHIVVDKVRVHVHRYSYQLHFGPIPPGLCVCHHCDNPKCVRPGHLFLGTNKDNTDDMLRKGRGPDQRGSRNPGSRLTEADVSEIKRRIRGKDRLNLIAQDFGVSDGTISQIKFGKTWKHVL